MDFELAMTQPHSACGTRDEEWRDIDHPVTRPDGTVVYKPLDPPPYVAEGVRCLGCARMAELYQALADENGGRLEPGVRVILRRFNPATD